MTMNKSTSQAPGLTVPQGPSGAPGAPRLPGAPGAQRHHMNKRSRLTRIFTPSLKHPPPQQDKHMPILRWTPYAWAKLLYLCHRGDTEIAGFGVSADNDPLLIVDMALIPQQANAVHVCFEDDAVADYFDSQIDAGRKPYQFARVWAHTHPGDSANPSPTDEATFSRVFGACDWAIMFILARNGATYARLRFNVAPQGPGGDIMIPVMVDHTQPFAASDQQAWDQAYKDCVQPLVHATFDLFDTFDELDLFDGPDEQVDGLDLTADQLDDDQQQYWLDEFELANTWSGMLAGAYGHDNGAEHTVDANDVDEQIPGEQQIQADSDGCSGDSAASGESGDSKIPGLPGLPGLPGAKGVDDE